jgi:DegV family protein with EDD domain
MDYRVLVDSCGELTQEMKESGVFESVPLSIHLQGETLVDDESFDQLSFLKAMEASPECPGSSCPSPEEYCSRFRCPASRIYVVTLSGQLSGSYNSAVLAKKLYEEEYKGEGEKQIHIFNSCSASVGETLIACKIRELEEAGTPFQEVVDQVEAYIRGQRTYFVLESLENLRKNGRLTGIKALVATALNIKPVMGSTPQGTIQQLGQARGMKKALGKLVEHVGAEARDAGKKILGIAYCNCRERAEAVRNAILERIRVRDCILVETRGISTLYANDGGVIVVL